MITNPPFSRRDALALLGMSIVAPKMARAETTWPTRNVKYLLGYAAGGTTDMLSRQFCQQMSELTGQPFVVENRSGAGGLVGAGAVAKAEPDGYTLGMGSIATHAIAVGTYANLPYRAGKDFTFITGLWRLPNVLVVRKDLPVRDLKELIALAKASPGKYSYASPGIGTSLHLSGEMMKSMAGIDLFHVPYRGSSPAIVDLLAGRVDMLFDNLPGSLGHIRGGGLRALAVSTANRSPAIPDVSAMSEVLPGYELTSWAALCGPAGIPHDLVAKINELSLQALKDPTLAAKFANVGAEPFPTSAADITTYRDNEEARFLPMIKAAGIVPI